MHKTIADKFLLAYLLLVLTLAFTRIAKTSSKYKLNKGFAPTFTALIGVFLVALSIRTWSCSVGWTGPSWLAIGFAPVSLRFDTLSAFFLLLLGCASTCSALFSSRYLTHLAGRVNARVYWSALNLFVLGMALVLLSANAIVFLSAWELMSLSSAVLVLSEHQRHKAQRACFIYLVATRVATVFLTAGFLLMFRLSHSFEFSSWTFSTPQTWLPAGLILAGLIIKAGLWPFHLWLPHAHPEAPSPVSALMSGVMVKIAVYATIRLFVLGHLNCQPIAYALFALSAVSAFGGVLFAINQRELKRLLAYSTVENIGIIFLALALSIWARNSAMDTIAQIALLAALLHSFGHGLIKSLLFLCAGSVDYAAHTREFAMLGGLNKRMPITGATFIVGSAAICALPPFNGFASKWCLYQALLQSSFSLPSIMDRAICLAAIGILSAVGALAIACFAKAIAVAFLGNPRSNHASRAHEAANSMTAPQIVLSISCLAMGVFVSFLVEPLSPILSVVGSNQPLDVFASIPLWQVALIMTSLLVLIYVFVLRRAPTPFGTWDCGFGKTSIKNQVTADSFAQPIARIFTPVLKYHVTVDISGRDRRHFPEKIVVEPSMVSLLETRLYRPAAQSLDRLSQSVAKLQAGSIHLYLTYVCIALAVLIALGTKL